MAGGRGVQDEMIAREKLHAEKMGIGLSTHWSSSRGLISCKLGVGRREDLDSGVGADYKKTGSVSVKRRCRNAAISLGRETY